jgi:hypothetical protein
MIITVINRTYVLSVIKERWYMQKQRELVSVITVLDQLNI